MAKSTKVKKTETELLIKGSADLLNKLDERDKEIEDVLKEETIEEWIEGTKKDLDERIAILAPNKPVNEEKTEQQKIMDYVANSHSEVVELSPILRSLYPLPTYASPAVYLQQGESKRLMGLLSAMKQDGELSLTNDQYLKLGKSYWVESDTKTRHYNIDTVKVFAIKK